MSELDTCREYMQNCLCLAFGPKELEECGIDLEGISSIDPKAKKLLEAAGKTGIDSILSKEDALHQVIIDEMVSQKLEKESACAGVDGLGIGDHTLIRGCLAKADLVKKEAEQEVRIYGIDALTKLDEPKRVAIQKQAERFMEDARALVEKIRASQKPVEPKKP
ncbi:MAG: hypothetical protein A2W61_05770 [Deltaproteobacteria bacterium RIFCSPLOWO2_01_44_7]|nr:MAG: hypothetical protein A2712_04460 [Deltaproteobacteria bacterium RIFCSPHIGHO2_01_FULL_43_49]OGQ16434.1 MAG: hypothetical protein A3D22_02425 [Deltaproteobacteria bacterium RIFCSPHIGHO2_02_FULL_44_53]OGQ27738.1 MAG: hypothetical protein A3D98_08560 [Deltaproteobacteria bacterium RIFCSPHIGHO2_12_FULL_44_21]OGQ32952.1 MAG: hypothetical protein A2979_10355 [Deltaproteobacteria bacterium RIFCSPLOWO2_01_FULL_45_74]OGQ40406.1 MAG: hypothetical protein A2W61_05770 [Deltaproteobacteria bacterium 